MFLLFNKTIKNQSELVELARTGIPKNAVLKMAKQLSFTGKELATIINLSERTLQRYPDNKKLEKIASEKAIQLAKLYERGKEVWGDLERFKGWMRHPNPFLSSKTPLEMLDTGFGFEMVLDEKVIKEQYTIYTLNQPMKLVMHEAIDFYLILEFIPLNRFLSFPETIKIWLRKLLTDLSRCHQNIITK
jgi:putative toxin-antitoxin system antitoxin component (TIGR02293 family)